MFLVFFGLMLCVCRKVYNGVCFFCMNVMNVFVGMDRFGV